jgi:DNA helicase-2/ATP-dependent DNA helicase PcrA
MSIFTLSTEPIRPSRRIDYSAELNQEQLDAVLHGDGPCLVLAGAGSGKTRTITYRVSYLLEQGVPPASILLLTFTNKASKEMRGRINELLGANAEGMYAGTFHSISARILRALSRELGYEPNFSILDQEDSRSLVKAVMKDMSIDPKARRFPTATVVLSIISFARNTQQSIREALELKHQSFLELESDIEEIARSYTERKKRANVMDFDDLLTNMAMLLDDPHIGTQISNRFHYVLVDEYQDTNALQARIVHGFARVHKNIFVVGDDAQSIYAFRGADVQNILQFPKEWKDAKIFKLLHNYRSTPEILEVANESLAHNQAQFEKDLIGTRDHGPKPKLVPCASAGQEARFVAEQVLSLRNEGTSLGNIAVLFRSSSHAGQLEFEFTKRDIPYEYRGGMKFFERAHIKDAIAFLRIYENPRDEIAWLRALHLQAGIGAKTAASILDRVKENEDVERALSVELALGQRAQNGWEELGRVMRKVMNEARFPAAMIRAVLKSSYRDYLEREYPNWTERVEDLEQLAVFAEGYEDVKNLLEELALYDEVIALREGAGKNVADDERVILSTIHQAKGLEWDTVIVVHLANQSFPNRRAMFEENQIEEERRLFYVATTRARQNLFLTYPMTIGHESLMLVEPSLFIEELSPRLFERVEVREPSASRQREARSSDWAWEDAWSEPAIYLDSQGERSDAAPSANKWKQSPGQKKDPPRTSFLSSIDDL